jgi:hypothetical protein
MFGAPPGSFVLVNSPQSSWIKGPVSLSVLGVCEETYQNYQRRLYHSTYIHKFSFWLLSRIKFYFIQAFSWAHGFTNYGVLQKMYYGTHHITKSVPYELFLLGYLVLQMDPWEKLGLWMDKGNSWGNEKVENGHPLAIKDFPHTSNTKALEHSVKDWHRRSSEAIKTILDRKQIIHF